MSEFIKYDKDKPMVSLVEPEFILGIARVLTFGVNKYGKHNWKKVDDIDRYKDAAMRHLLAYIDNEQNDKETGESHLYHLGCCIMFCDWYDRQKEDNVKSKRC